MFETITEKLQAAFRKLAGRGKLTEANIRDGLREVRLALLEADVHYKVVKDFIDKVTVKAVGQAVIDSISPAQQIVKIVHDELTQLMGGPLEPGGGIPLHSGTTVIMMVGLQGCGKTTTCAKLARYLLKKGRHPLLVAADIQRPAAVAQLKALGKQLNIPVYSVGDEHPVILSGAKDLSNTRDSSSRQGGIQNDSYSVGNHSMSQPVRICAQAVKFAQTNNLDVVILDTAGRLHINQELMDELKEITNKVKPDQTFLVADAMTGQDAVNSASEFNKQLPLTPLEASTGAPSHGPKSTTTPLTGLTGVILTKLDGDARGGAALSVKAVTGKPIKFVGIGEKPDNFEEFYPDRMAGRILGMGDVVSLVEKAQESMDNERAKKLEEKLLKNKLDLQDFLDQLHQIKKMGSLKDLMAMIPGVGSAVKDIDDKQLKKVEAMIQSMTPDERSRPEIIDGRRRNRIAKGSGTSVQDINLLLKQFNEMQKMMKNIPKGFGKGMMGKMFGRP